MSALLWLLVLVGPFLVVTPPALLAALQFDLVDVFRPAPQQARQRWAMNW